MLKAGNQLFENLNQLPYHTFINIGFESVDESTIRSLKKPLKISKIHEAFQKMLHINRSFPNIEITGNFVLGDQLSPNHHQSLIKLLQSIPSTPCLKGAIYLSPLMGRSNKQVLLPTFLDIKKQSSLPTFMYLIQRL